MLKLNVHTAALRKALDDTPAPVVAPTEYFSFTYAFPGTPYPYGIWHVAPTGTTEIDRVGTLSAAEHYARMANLGAPINRHAILGQRITPRAARAPMAGQAGTGA